MKHLKSFNEKKDHDTLSMFKHLWDDISDDDDFDVEFEYDSTFKSYTAVIRCDKKYILGSTVFSGRSAHDDGFSIKELGNRLLLPFVYSEELGIRIDYIHARDTADEFYAVEECLGYTPTLDDVIMGRHTIVEFLEEWERDYIKGDDKLLDLKFTFLTVAYEEISESIEIEPLIRDILVDATDEGIRLDIRKSFTGSGFSLEVILDKYESVDPFTLKDIKPGIDSLLSMLEDEYKLIRVSIDSFDSSNHLQRYNNFSQTQQRYGISQFDKPWEYVQHLIKDNSFQRTYPDRDFPLKAIKLLFNLKSHT